MSHKKEEKGKQQQVLDGKWVMGSYRNNNNAAF